MEVKSFTPQNPLLRNYIECFYTLTREMKNENSFSLPETARRIGISRTTWIKQ